MIETVFSDIDVQYAYANSNQSDEKDEKKQQEQEQGGRVLHKLGNKMTCMVMIYIQMFAYCICLIRVKNMKQIKNPCVFYTHHRTSKS